MRIRHSTGGVRKQRGRWLGLWYEGGKKKSRVVGFVAEMTKGEAREAVAKIVAALKRDDGQGSKFGEFVENIFFPFLSRKWKASTRENKCQRIRTHLVEAYRDRELFSFRRDELQDLLDAKAKTENLSFSVVAHLRWDLKSIFGMAVAEGHIERNPALLLFVPKEAAKPVRRVMTIDEVRLCLSVLAPRERLIAKMALLCGMRPGEIFGLTWGQVADKYADVRQRVYRGLVDTPKTNQSWRKAALAAGLAEELDEWRLLVVDSSAAAWVFPSERRTPLSKDNIWRRNMLPKLSKAGLDWTNFQVFRRTNSTLLKMLGADGKLVADQLGHSLDVNQNIYTQSPVESRLGMVNDLEKSLLVVQ